MNDFDLTESEWKVAEEMVAAVDAGYPRTFMNVRNSMFTGVVFELSRRENKQVGCTPHDIESLSREGFIKLLTMQSGEVTKKAIDTIHSLSTTVKTQAPLGEKGDPEKAVETSDIVPTVEADGESVLAASSNDQPTITDALGFEPYVLALESFLRNEETTAPLAISIEGAWGSGKSSFMLQLKERIKRDHFVIFFNAWRHDGDQSLWSAFALEFGRQLARQLTLAGRSSAWFRLFCIRFNWRNGWNDAAKFASRTAAILLLLFTLPYIIANHAGWVVSSIQTSRTTQPPSTLSASTKTTAPDQDGLSRDSVELLMYLERVMNFR